MLNIALSDSEALPREVLFDGFFVLQLAGAAVLLTHGRVGRDYVPVAYACAFSLCATVLYLSESQTLGIFADVQTYQLIFVNALLAGGLIALFAWAAGSVEALKRPPLILASVGAVLLGMVSAPGAMLSIGLMILGYAKHDRLLLVLGAVLMPAFLWLYYYNLDVSLLDKSLILAGRFYISHVVQGNEA